MFDESSPQLLTLAGIAHRCAQETDLFFRRQSYDPRYCFELFRRAILERNERAWEHIYDQYRPLVAGWVGRHPAFPSSGEEVQYFVNRALEKMWVALTPAKFHRFSNLKSLLRYLQMCVDSVIVDYVRLAEQRSMQLRVEVETDGISATGPSVEAQALNQMGRQKLWWEINARLRNEKERLVVYGSFPLGLKPRELYAQFQGTFQDVNEVYRVKENVLARLRRDAVLQELLRQDA